MNLDTPFIIIALIRTLLVVAVIYHFGKYMDAHPPNNKLLKKWWKSDKKFRKFLIHYYWQIGVVFFLAQIIVGLIVN